MLWFYFLKFHTFVRTQQFSCFGTSLQRKIKIEQTWLKQVATVSKSLFNLQPVTPIHKAACERVSNTLMYSVACVLKS